MSGRTLAHKIQVAGPWLINLNQNDWFKHICTHTVILRHNPPSWCSSFSCPCLHLSVMFAHPQGTKTKWLELGWLDPPQKDPTLSLKAPVLPTTCLAFLIWITGSLWHMCLFSTLSVSSCTLSIKMTSNVVLFSWKQALFCANTRGARADTRLDRL